HVMSRRVGAVPSLAEDAHELDKFLIFNGTCGVCAILASTLHELSDGRIELVKFQSSHAEELLAPFYPDGPPFSFFLVERRKGNWVCRKGTRTALRLARLLTPIRSLRLLVSYVALRSMACNPPKPRKHIPRTGGAEFASKRRDFLRADSGAISMAGF